MAAAVGSQKHAISKGCPTLLGHTGNPHTGNQPCDDIA